MITLDKLLLIGYGEVRADFRMPILVDGEDGLTGLDGHRPVPAPADDMELDRNSDPFEHGITV